MIRLIGAASALLFLISAAADASAAIIYMRSTVGAPWGQTTNEQAMNSAFGPGGWLDQRFETTSAATTFTGSNSFVYLEGSDTNANELEAFLNSNLATIQSWVAAGGSLFINAAPNEGDGMSFGFGGVALQYLAYPISAEGTVSASSPLHPIFTGPMPTATSFSGGSYSHARVIGAGLTPLLQGPDGDMALAEKDYGLGHVIFGGMTTTNFHSPQPQAFNLRVNILKYGATQANQVASTPEPASLALWGLGSIGLAIGGAYRSFRGKRRGAHVV